MIIMLCPVNTIIYSASVLNVHHIRNWERDGSCPRGAISRGHGLLKKKVWYVISGPSIETCSSAAIAEEGGFVWRLY